MFKFLFSKRDEGINCKRKIFGISVTTKPNRLKLKQLDEKIEKLKKENTILNNLISSCSYQNLTKDYISNLDSTKPFVSVIITVYNLGRRYLVQCLESVINQTLEDIEIIPVDDGSPDKCGEICDVYAARDNRIKVLHKKNAGVSAARNDGLLQASGEYILFCDSDDWMEKDACEKLYSAATKSNADIAIGDVYMAYDSGEKKAVKFYENEFCIEDRDRIDDMIRADIYRTYCVNPPKEGVAFGYGGPWNKLVRREMLLDNEINFDLRVKGVFDDMKWMVDLFI